MLPTALPVTQNGHALKKGIVTAAGGYRGKPDSCFLSGKRSMFRFLTFAFVARWTV